MRKQLLFVFGLLITFTTSAQKFNELGLTGGVSYYLGDVNQVKQFYKPRPAFGVFFKRNMSDYYAIRANLQQIIIAGSDADFNNGYQQQRNHSFKNRMYELNSVFEFNFLPYNPAHYYRFAPYVTGGIGVLYDQNSKAIIDPVIPIGLGFKYAPNKKISISAEWVFRKTFTDTLDGLFPQNETSTTNFIPKQVTDRNGTDWYSSFLVVIGFNITSEKVRCAAYPGITRRYK